MTVLFYGRLADLAGARLDFEMAPGQSIQALRQAIAELYPELADALRSKAVRACIGDTIVQDDHVIAPGEVIEFFPPVSGG